MVVLAEGVLLVVDPAAPPGSSAVTVSPPTLLFLLVVEPSPVDVVPLLLSPGAGSVPAAADGIRRKSSSGEMTPVSHANW